jgi:hypothetical protein
MVDPLIRTVYSMMARFGGDATLVVDSGESTYDPETSTTISSVTEYPVRIIAQDYIQKSLGLLTKAGTTIQTGDKWIFVQPSEDSPLPRAEVDCLLFEGKKWVVKVVKDHNPSGTKSYLYEIYARA